MKNRIKIWTLLLAFAMVSIVTIQFGIGGALAEDPEDSYAPIEGSSDYIYFDLNAGGVTFNGTSYEGKIFKTENGTTTTETVKGTHTVGNKYYIYQSNPTNYKSTGRIDGKIMIPQYPEVRYNGESWSEYISDYQEPDEVRENWDNAIKDTGRTPVGKDNRIVITELTNTTLDIVLDNVWNNYQNLENWTNLDNDKKNYTAVVWLKKQSHVTLLLKGDNRLANIFSISDDKKNSSLAITSFDGNDSKNGSLTLVNSEKITKTENFNVALIGGGNSDAGFLSLKINGGTIYAGIPKIDNSKWSSAKILHCIGGRAESYIDINGGRVTAISNSTAAAIGGGGGYNSKGGKGYININGGNVKAYNNCIYNNNTFVPCTAIGSGSCTTKDSAESVIKITGGTVYAQSRGGVAIGGGGSSNQNGGTGKVTISGGDITALSLPGTVASGVPDVKAGVAIGGGVGGVTAGKNGGDAEITITGGKIVSGSVGGGSTSNSTGRTGYAKVDISGNPDIQAQFVMAGGGSKACSFTMTGGIIHNVDTVNTSDYLHDNGAALWMNDTNGIAKISGGTIENCTAKLGGAVYMTGGTFTLSGSGNISGNTAVNTSPNTSPNTGLGGAVYMGGGKAEINGGTLGSYGNPNNAERGGGIYVNGGDASVSDGAVQYNSANEYGGGIYVTCGNVTVSGGSVNNNGAKDGGGVYLPDGDFKMTGGTISANTVSNNGAGIHLTQIPELNGGNITGNIADKYGGGFYIEKQHVTLSPSGEMHISENKASHGGGAYIGGTESNTASFSVDNTHGGKVLIHDNVATEYGGGICLYHGNFEISNDAVSMYGNRGFSGGAVAVLEGTFDLKGTGSLGEEEKACNNAVNGGGVYVEGGDVEVEGGKIVNNIAACGGGVYLSGGEFTLDGGSIESNKAENGGGVYLDKISPILHAGTITNNTALTISDDSIPSGSDVTSPGNGGGIYINKYEVNLSPSGEVVISDNEAEKNGAGLFINGTNGTDAGFKVASAATGVVKLIGNNAASSGGGVCIYNGYFLLDSDKINITKNKADNGGGVAVLGGNVTVSGGSVGESGNGNEAVNGGGIYLLNGDVLVTGGLVNYNKADNGGGVYVSDGMVTIYGGNIDYNTASSRGGGIFVSAENENSLVDILSGSISHNSAASDGGGIAILSTTDVNIDVIVGVNAVHPALNISDRSFTAFNYPAPSECGAGHEGHTNHLSDMIHESCPEIIGNRAGNKGGSFYLSSIKTNLLFYCVTEKDSVAGDPQCNSMYMEGGTVQIVGDDTYDGTGHAKGNIIIQSSILVEGGCVDVYGEMTNPQFTNDVIVNIKDIENDHFIDHRKHAEEDAHYKVHYVENFKGESDVATGMYISRQYPDTDHINLPQANGRYEFTIMPSIFVHSGYRIIGWCTNPKPVSTNPDEPSAGDTWYKINETYDLTHITKEQGMGSSVGLENEEFHDPKLLRIYAIWERCGYVLHFDPNIPSGYAYSGSMENQRVTVGILGGSQKIRQNNFQREGYIFTGWTLSADGTGTLYGDKHSIIEDFTDIDGKIITLYAQWEKCTHVDNLVYTADGNKITETCSACGCHEAAAVITSVDTVYDGSENLASVTYSSEWLGGTLDVSYKLHPSAEWDAKDEVDDNWNDDSKPVHAGKYTASISAGEGPDKVSADTIYTISPVKWGTPAVPGIMFKIVGGKSVIEITNPLSDEDHDFSYKITRLDSDAEIAVTGYPDWQDDSTFTDIPVGYYYYFYAKQIADRDHLESDYSRSEAYLATGGNIVYINNDNGIQVKFDSGTGDFVYTVNAADGYHYRNYTDNADTAAANAKPIDGAESDFYHDGGILVNKETIGDTYKYTVKFVDGKVAFYQVTLDFHGAAKDASVNSKVTDGQVFRNFNAKETAISRDSAFTAQFTVSDYIPDEYDKQQIEFSTQLPKGTTVIMNENNKYWYYNLTDKKTAIDLTEFTAMGGSELYAFDKTSDTVKPDFTYQFIVDFSQAESEPEGNNLKMDLKLSHNTVSDAPDVPASGNHHVSIDLKDHAKFEIKKVVNNDSALLSLHYTASEGTASIWNGRKTALVLTANNDVPADLKLTVKNGGSNTVYSLNQYNQFIIPLPLTASQDIELSLDSAMLSDVEQNYSFDADWFVSQSNAGSAPVNGIIAASEQFYFSCKSKSVTSLKIEDAERLVPVGGVLDLNVQYKHIPANATITAYLQSKNGNSYIDTGARTNIPVEAAGEKEIEFNMGTMSPGSYRVLAVVTQSGGNILTVPYYFIITPN